MGVVWGIAPLPNRMRPTRPEITILATLHLGFMLVSQLPGEIPFLESYHWLTNTRQNWHMFYSAYTYREQDFVVIANDGTEFQAAPPRHMEKEGADLPIRLINHLGRLKDEGSEESQEVWVERLAEEVERGGGSSFAVEFRSLRIRNFHYSRKDGELYKEMVERLGPIPIKQ